MSEEMQPNVDEPLWMHTLRTRVQESSQRAVAQAIGYTNAVVSAVLSNSYRGNLANVEMAVRGAFMGETVGCPVMGELPSHNCLEYQRQPYASTNSQRIRLYKACRGGCANSQIGKQGDR